MDVVSIRKELLEKLGGIPEPLVKNEEWLYLLKEESRNSVMIEGYFVSSEDLEEVLMGEKELVKSGKEALDYYKTASFIYNFAYENFKTRELPFTESLIKQINKGVLGQDGDYRKGDIKIMGAKISPPNSFYIADWIRLYVDWVREYANTENFIDFIAKQHILFEAIHPFSDGNGRTGRVILNYLLISKGYPHIIIKGDEKNKERYIKALEQGDIALFGLLNNIPDKNILTKTTNAMNASIMKEIITESLIRSLDIMLAPIVEKKLGIVLKSSTDVAIDLNYSKDSIRELIKRGYFIAIKKGKTWFTHKELDVRNLR